MNNRYKKLKELAAILLEVEKHLDDRILYNKNSDDITDSFLKTTKEMQCLLSKSQNSADDFRKFQRRSNPFKIQIMISVQYPEDDNATILLMRKLVDAITVYNETCAPELRRLNSQPLLFGSSPDVQTTTEDPLTLSPVLSRKH